MCIVRFSPDWPARILATSDDTQSAKINIPRVNSAYAMLEIPETLSLTPSWQVSLRSRHASLIFYHRASPRYSSSPNKGNTANNWPTRSIRAALRKIDTTHLQTAVNLHRSPPNFYDTQPANYKNELSSMEHGPTPPVSISISIRWTYSSVSHPR